MPRTDKTSGRLHSVKPSSAQALSVPCLGKGKENPDFLLTGSQIHLACRPKWGSGKTRSCFTSVLGICSKRPVSAIPAFGHQDTHGAGETWKRPQSANNSYFPEGDISVSSSATSDCDGTERIAHTQCNGTCRNNFSTKFSLLDENVHKCVSEEKPHNREAEPDGVFGATYILPSSQLFEYVTSEPLGRTWTESELKACCEELGIEDHFCNRCEHESVSSDCSNGQCNSETSVGEQITAMVQDRPLAELPHALVLEPGLASKPFLPQYSMRESGCIQTLVHSRDKYFNNNVNYEDILFEKFNHGCSLTDKPYCLNQSTKDKYVLVSGEQVGNNAYTCSMIPMIFPNQSQKGLVNNVPEDKIITQQYSSVKVEIPMNTEHSSQHVSESQSGKEIQDFNDQCKNLLELKYRPFTQNLTHSVNDDVPSDLRDTQVQHWIPDSVSKSIKVPNSVMCEMERQTDILDTNLLREQCHLDCSDSYQDLGVMVGHAGDSNSVYMSKPRRQELYLQCLVDEDIDEYGGSSSIKRSENVEKCSVSNSDHPSVKVKKQGEICHMEVNITSSALLPSQRTGDKADTEPQEMPSVCGDFEGNGNVSHNMCNGRKSEENDKSVDLYTERSVTVPDNGTEISRLNTHLESPEQCQQFVHIPAESAQSLATDSTVHSNLTLGNVEHDVVEKSSTPSVLDHISVLPPPTSVAPQNHDLNVSTVEPLGSSTYDDIITILRVLEQEETCSLPKLDHLKLSPDTEISCSESFLNTDISNNTLNISVTDGKLRDILTFLDEAEHCCNTTSESAKTQFQAVKDTTQNNELKFTAVPRVEELLNLSTVDLAHEVLTLHLQLEEKSKSINLLQRTLNQQRELAVRNARNAAHDIKKRLREQKDEYESAVARHQKFIDQLIADKKSLSEKCESLVLELKKSEEHHINALKAVEHRHSVELQRVREMHAAAEKLRRERWIDNKTKKIKEMTVKGLEPELQRMNTRHQQEISDLRLLHKQELDELELRAARKTAQQMEQLRDLLTAEKEEALAREKDLLRQRIEKQAEQEQLECQAQQHRLLAEIHREKERLAEEETRMNQELEETKQNVSRESAKVIERLKQEHQETVEACTRRHQNEVKSLKEALEMEKEAWMLSCKKDQTTQISERESEIRNQCKRERDKEIELIIERLESDATKSRAELEQAMDNRLRRLKEKFDAEIRDLEVSEKAIKSKYNETKGKLVEKEDEVINLKTNARHLEKELEEAKKIVDRLSAERAEVKEVVRKELINQVTAAEQENIRLREEMAELRTVHKLELSGKADGVARIMKDKERQLQQVYNRVRLAVAKRDETIQKLKSQYESALERCSYLEELLEQQRRDFLLK